MSLSKELIKEIKDKSDIVSIIGDYVHSLKRSGKNWIGLCPFHNDKSPSFSVSEDYGMYKCFACGESGDIIKFIEKIENISFSESVLFLAKRSGITVEIDGSRESSSKNKEILISFNDRVVKLFQHFLLEMKEGESALQYLEMRGIDRNIIEMFKIGYAPKEFGRFERLLKTKGFKDEFLVESGFFSLNENRLKTLFFDRVVFPIFNYRNECVGFGARTLNNEVKPKYINSPETILYKKSFNLYGINFAREFIQKDKKVFIVEGYVDVISCYKSGVKNVVAPCGTALTKDQVKLLSRYCSEVVLLLDADEAGLKGAVKALNEFANIENIRSSVLVLPDGKDPDDYFKKHDLSDFIELEKKKLSGFDFLIFYKTRDYNRGDYTSLVNVLNFLFEYISLWSRDVIRNSFIEQIALALNIDKGIVSKEFVNFGKRVTKNEPETKTSNKDDGLSKNLTKDKQQEIDLLLILTNLSDSIDLVKRCGLRKDFFYYDETKKIFETFFENDFLEKKNILDFFVDDICKNYITQKIFSDELKSDESVLRNSAVDRIVRVINKFYERKIEELKESIRLAELYKDEDFVKELMEERDILAKEILKLKKLQELKK